MQAAAFRHLIALVLTATFHVLFFVSLVGWPWTGMLGAKAVVGVNDGGEVGGGKGGLCILCRMNRKCII